MRNLSEIFRLLVFRPTAMIFYLKPDYPVKDILPVIISVVFPHLKPAGDCTSVDDLPEWVNEQRGGTKQTKAGNGPGPFRILTFCGAFTRLFADSVFVA